ncbi:MAG TPA: hypothetical protein ENF30_02675 [Candidatus Desulfofervidus auxilii]|uniref:Nucleoside phosphorylase domain-containing protein n=1 Tax=Desulfofervidus auxilii TaxID=1621989 RepID=A0A7V0IAR3_DESA2|nr:hypothetical protein [Candidatus Desulfofervidus auxilii]
MDIDILIVAHPLDLNYFLSHAQKPLKKQSIYLAKMFLFSSLAIIGPCLGADQLRLILRKTTQDAKKILFLGWCGGINVKKIGEIILARGAFKNLKMFLPNNSLLFELSSQIPFFHRQGFILSVENSQLPEEMFHFYKKLGIMAIDMETATLYEFCIKNKIETVSILMVSDIVNGKTGFTHPEFKKIRKTLLKWIIEKWLP